MTHRAALALLLLAAFALPALAGVEDAFRTLDGAPAAALAGEGAAAAGVHVFLNTDGLMSKAKDRAFMEAFKAELAKLGVRATVSPYCSLPDNHVRSIRNCPQGAWVVTAASGICAGTYRDMALGRTGYLKTAWERNGIRGLIFLNLSPHLLKEVPFLKRAWDDNFSPAGFTGIERPYEYLTKHGFHVAESPVANRPELNPARVPVLARQIAAIVLGAGATVPGSAATPGAQKGATDVPALVRTGSDIRLPAVSELQRKLKALGLYPRQVDGWFGPWTEAGVRALQRRHGLPVTGVANRETLATLGLAHLVAGGGSSARTPVPPGGPPDHSGMEKWLAATAKAKTGDPAVRALAAKLKGGTDRQTALQVIAWMRANVRYKYYNNSAQSAAAVLASRAANCCDQASAVVSLLRAAGVPARWRHSTACVFTSGLRAGHIWAEANIDGQWLSIDTTSGANALGALRSFRALAAVKTYDNLPF